MTWVALVREHIVEPVRHVALDGKTSRRSHDRPNGKSAIHTVNAYLTEEGYAIGQTQAKSHEITAIPELLMLLDLRGAVVSVDAMGCHTANASAIVDAGRQYLLSVKENQPPLYQGIQETFEEAHDERRKTMGEVPRPGQSTASSVNNGHGGIEERSVHIGHCLEWVAQEATRWKNLSTLIQVNRRRILVAMDKTAEENAYNVCYAKHITAEQAGATIRKGWSLQHGLHWILDMGFKEDHARHGAWNCRNISISPGKLVRQ